MSGPAVLSSADLSAQDLAESIFVGRQPIFDRKLEVVAYELLYRGGNHTAANVIDGDRASSLTLLNAFMGIGLERIAGPHKVFVNLTRRFFTDMPPIPFEKDRVVLELLEDIEVDQRLLDSVRALKARGFVLAIDDYLFEPKWDPVLPLVNVVKVDVKGNDWELLERRLPGLCGQPAQVLAEKVETREEFDRLLDMGCDLFQGFFFARPALVEGRRLQENRLAIVRLMSRLNDPGVTIEELEGLIAQDLGLSYKVLRFINSAAAGLPRQVESIRQAVIYMGLDRIRAWVSLLALAGMDDKPREVLNLGLVRAHLCERLVRSTGEGAPETAYTVGLLSILDIMMDTNMDDLVDQFPLPGEIAAAILRQEGACGRALACARALEIGRWDQLVCAGYNGAMLTEAYLESTHRAFQILAAVG